MRLSLSHALHCFGSASGGVAADPETDPRGRVRAHPGARAATLSPTSHRRRCENSKSRDFSRFFAWDFAPDLQKQSATLHGGGTTPGTADFANRGRFSPVRTLDWHATDLYVYMHSLPYLTESV
ncbi:hypothetical protein MTP99_006002 [Tenebrio molitor]|nr:hypothetical protein MTP99_006002 [Tenebrio molitor]